MPDLFSAGYGNVGSSIYYALGIVAVVALGATPVVLGIAGILFIFTALTYAEGTSMFPEAGGSASFSKHSFNNLIGFTAGWALMLSYIVTISISVFTIPPYLGLFWIPLKDTAEISTAVSIGIVVLLMTVNIIGVKETSLINILLAIIDIATQISIIIIGLIFIFSPTIVWHRIIDNWPTIDNLILGIALSTIAYTGIETISQMAEETRRPSVRVPRALILMIVTVPVVFMGLSIVAFSAMTPVQLASEWSRDPVAGIAANLPLALLQDILRPIIAILAASILLVAANAGIMGISRLSYYMANHGLQPLIFSRLHPRFKTPYVSIIIFGIVAILILIPGFFATDVFKNMGALYAFGSLLSFMFAHASIIALRIKKPQLERPFKIGLNIKINQRQIPVSAILALIILSAIWVIIFFTQPYSRYVGVAWMAIGLIFYYLLSHRTRRVV
ncbi:MAG: APC family permease [Dehalococcoidia bacterium]|nr:APC family permease [Dehalococcoidia bacterium]